MQLQLEFVDLGRGEGGVGNPIVKSSIGQVSLVGYFSYL